MNDYNINFEDQPASPKTNQQNFSNPYGQNHQQEVSSNEEHPKQPYQKQEFGKDDSKPAPTGCTRFCSLDFYEQFFKVTQNDVIERIKLAVIPLKTNFIQETETNPDFYGPFWLLTTIIFLVSSTGNLSRYFFNWSKDAYIFKLELVRYAVLVVYSFGFGVPTLLYFIMKFLGVTRLSLPNIICLYGYSFAPFIPIFLLCIIPSQVVQWLLIAYGMVATGSFLILSLKEYLNEIQPPKMYLIFGIIGGAQIALFLTFKLVFFKLVYEESS